jgi:hypothetical protein
MVANLALARTYAPADPFAIQEDFAADGAHILPEALDRLGAAAILHRIRAGRSFDASLFLTEAEFEADPQHRGVDPRPGRNLLEGMAQDLTFVEEAPAVKALISTMLGRASRILDKKVVCAVPDREIPDWVRRRIGGTPVNNLGAFVRPELRDVTYVYGADYHQDLTDVQGRDADFITLHVYLHDIGRTDAPLHLLEGSHLLGAAVPPHDLIRLSQGLWRYADGRGQILPVRERVLTGSAGFAAAWHACTLHGAQPSQGEGERISLRYLIAKGEAAGETGLDKVNRTLLGPMRLEEPGVDLDDRGAAVMARNASNDG